MNKQRRLTLASTEGSLATFTLQNSTEGPLAALRDTPSLQNDESTDPINSKMEDALGLSGQLRKKKGKKISLKTKKLK